MTKNHSRRDVLKLIGATGAVLAVSEVYAATTGDATVEAASSITPLLRYYSADARNNVVVKNRRRAMLSSHVYPKATFVRDSFYGPLALNDVNLGAECYRWFAETQNPATGQIRCAVPFDPKNEYLFQIWDDDSSLLFVIWAAWLKRNRVRSIKPSSNAPGRSSRPTCKMTSISRPRSPSATGPTPYSSTRRSAWPTIKGCTSSPRARCWSTAGAASSPPMSIGPAPATPNSIVLIWAA